MKTATLRVSTNGNEAAIEGGRTFVVGRSLTSDLVIDDERVSRRHLVIASDGTGWSVRDVSSNGTWAGDQRVAMMAINGEVRLRLGRPDGPEVIITDEAPTLTFTDQATAAAVPPSQSRPLPPPRVGRPPTVIPIRTSPIRATMATPTKRRWPWIVLLGLVIAFVAVDRMGVVIATTQVVDQVRTSQKLPAKPQATIGGFPFLSQVAVGKYSDVHVTIRDLQTPGPRLARISATLKGVHVPLSAAINNKVKSVPVDSVSASVLVNFSDLNGFLKDKPGGLQVGSNGSGLQLTGQIPGLDLALGALMSANIDVGSNDFTMIPGDLLGGLTLPGRKSSLDRLTTKIPLGGLPFDLKLLSVKVHSDSVEFAASAGHVVLPAK